jgi:hypothetical protein
MTPKPRKAKNVRATLATMSLKGGYSAEARSPGSMLVRVAMAKTMREPKTTITTTVWAWATAFEPATLRSDITTITSTANVSSHPAPPSVNISLA